MSRRLQYRRQRRPISARVHRAAPTSDAEPLRARRKDWRASIPVLVFEAQSVASLGAIRSLGRAGYQVHASSTDPDAIGLFSRFVSTRTSTPPYESPDFIPWLRSYVNTHRIRALIPSEGLLIALQARAADGAGTGVGAGRVIDEFAPILPLSTDPRVLAAGLGKYDLFAQLGRHPSPDVTANLPPFLLVDDPARLPTLEALRALPRPLFVKADALHGRTGRDGSLVHRGETAEEALEILRTIAPRYAKLLVQGFVPGTGAGVFFLQWGGERRATFMNLCLHEVPHTGGYASLRESWFDPAVERDAIAKIEAIGWEGVAMLEYRFEPSTGRYWMIEMNPRFWASIHLALACGIDFPRLLVDAFFGHHEHAPPRWAEGVRCRYTHPYEIQHVWSLLRDPSVSRRRQAWAVLEHFLLYLDPRIHADLLFPGDRQLYVRRLARFLRTRK